MKNKKTGYTDTSGRNKLAVHDIKLDIVCKCVGLSNHVLQFARAVGKQSGYDLHVRFHDSSLRNTRAGEPSAP